MPGLASGGGGFSGSGSSLEEGDILRAAYSRNLDLVDIIIEKYPQAITYQDHSTGFTALHIASGHGNLAMARHLLSKPGADPGIVDRTGRTALDMAIDIAHQRLIDLLYRHVYPKNFIDDSPV